MRQATRLKRPSNTRAEAPDSARRGRRARRGRSGSGRLSDHGSDRYDRCSADIKFRIALRGADVGQGLDYNEKAHSAVRAESHHKAPCGGDVLPHPAAAVQRHRKRSLQSLQSGQHGPVAGSEEAVVPDVDEAVREDVLGVAPHELHPVKCHLLDLAAVPVVLVLEGDAPVADGEDAPVADGHAVGVACKVLQRTFRSADRGLRIHHPRLGEALGADLVRDVRDGGEPLHELGPEHLAQRPHREEERLLLAVLDLRKVLPPVILQVPSATGHDAVQVGMEHQCAAPGVQQGRHAKTHACRLSESVQRLPRRMEQRRIGRLLVAVEDAVQRVRQGEHHVEVRHGKEFLLARKQPCLPLCVLAAGTVAVTAAVIERMLLAAFGTHRDMPAKGLCTAVADMLEHAGLVHGRMIPCGPRRPEPPQSLLYAAFHGLPIHGKDEVRGTRPAGIIRGRGHVQVARGRPQVRVPQPFLDVANIDPMLKQMSCEAMPQSVAVDMFDDGCPFHGPCQHLRWPGVSHLDARCLLEHITLRMIGAQVGCHHLPHVHGKWNVTVFAALALADMDAPAVKIKITQLKVQNLAFPGASVIKQAQDGLLPYFTGVPE